jgi:excinuclease ABC subunit A
MIFYKKYHMNSKEEKLQEFQSSKDFIYIKGAREHNLKIDELKIPKNQVVVITGVSGSGKSSLAFDTIYVEGKRRYLNSLSSYARHIEIHDKPELDEIIGLSPTIAIEQKNITRNPRSTVATITEIYDYLRLLWARVGVPHSPATGQPITKHSAADIIARIETLPLGTKVYFIIPGKKQEKNDYRTSIINFKKHDASHIIVDGTIYNLDDLPLLNNQEEHLVEAVSKELVIKGDLENKQMIINQVYKCLRLGEGVFNLDLLGFSEIEFDTVKSFAIKDRKRFVFSEKFCCPLSGFQIDEIEPKLFSFNSPQGACKTCDGLGSQNAFSKDLIIANSELSINDGAIAPWNSLLSKTATVQQQKYYDKVMEILAKHYNFSLDTPFQDLSEKVQKIILEGSDEAIQFTYGAKTVKKPFEGIIALLEKELEETTVNYVLEELKKYQINIDCKSCNGTRLKQEALAVRVLEHNIGSLCKLTMIELYDWFKNLSARLTASHKEIAEKSIEEVLKRLEALIEIGVGYLTLNRRSASLSGGESQRIRIGSQLECGLRDLIYVLDEPSIGLHQSDNDKLLKIMKNLCNRGNTLLVVEHDEDTIRSADYLIDVGPGAGRLGGHIVAAGLPSEVAKVQDSITGQYLSGRLKISLPKERRKNLIGYLEVLGASSFNLKNLDVKVPLGCFVAITGVSGSGKSTFAIHTLYKHLMRAPKDSSGKCRAINGVELIDKMIQVDQLPIGRTPRSNPITYINAFAAIREVYATLPEAKSLGYNAGCFSFNVKGGRCENCEGDGVIKIEMHFMPDVYIKCDACNGMRYNSQILQIKFKNTSISDLLNLTTDEALPLFVEYPFIHEKLVALQEVGLGYLQLGQSATTLSGGEAQRIKLAKELSKRSIGHTLYILDEPTTGLHSHDISKLLHVLHKLVDNGHSVITIEHNLDVIKNADYILDFGPHGGNLGGELVATGTPEEVAENPRSLTGKYLKSYLKN